MRNLITREMVALLRADFDAGHFGHQQRWAETNGEPSRMILTARQTGATRHFSRERALTALETGKDQVIIFPHQKSGEEFLRCIGRWVSSVCRISIKLTRNGLLFNRLDESGLFLRPVHIICIGSHKGEFPEFHNNFSADVTFQDFFWADNFSEALRWGKSLAKDVNNTLTCYSAINDDVRHDARPIWSGAVHNWKTIGAPLDFDVPRHWLRQGYIGADGIWRQIVTIDDAIAGGFELVDVAALRTAFSPEEFRQLYQCEFSSDMKKGQHHA
jgi:hypothetical protein